MWQLTLLSDDMLTATERGKDTDHRYIARVKKVADALAGKELNKDEIFSALVAIKALPNNGWGRLRLMLLMDLGLPIIRKEAQRIYLFIDQYKWEGKIYYRFILKNR